jgi:hypothetical protein
MSPRSRSGMVRGFRNSEIGIGVKDAIDVLGVSIDSQSFDQSLIDQSINSRKKKVSKIKKKEDLDGSKLYRRDKSAAANKKKKTPQKQNFFKQEKQSLGAVVNKKGKMLEEKKVSMGPNEQRSRGMSISSGKSNTQLEGGEVILQEFIRSNQSNSKMVKTVTDITDLCYSNEDNAFLTEIDKIN